MTILPIVERELRVAARRPGTHQVRLMAAVAVMGFGWAALAAAPAGAPPHEAGKAIFALETALAFGFSLLSGVFLTADCLSEEKREGTLGLLFLTDLKGYDIVLGKLTATALQSIYGLLAIFPLLGLPLLMGGVSLGEFGRALLALLLTLMLSLAAGLFVSALARGSRQTLVLTLGLLLAVAGLPPVVAWLQYLGGGTGAVVGPWFLLSPVGALILAFDAYYRAASGPAMFWTATGCLAVLAGGMMAGAGLVLPRRLAEGLAENPARAGRGRRTRTRPDSRVRPAGLGDHRAPLERNPYYWLVSRDRQVRRLIWPGLVILGTIWFAFVTCGLVDLPVTGRSRREDAFGIGFIVAFCLHQYVKTLVALEATRRLQEDRQSGALELVLATPLPPEVILRGQWLGLRRHFFRPFLLLTAVNLALLGILMSPSNPMDMQATDRGIFAAIFLGGVLLLAFDFRALGWVGMLMALTRRTQARAVLATLGRVMLPAWAALFAMVTVGEVSHGLSEGAVELFVLLWLIGGMLLSSFLGNFARRRLLRHFRALAAGVNEARARSGSRAGTRSWRPGPVGAPAGEVPA